MIKYQQNSVKTEIPFVQCAPDWDISDDMQYIDEFEPYYLGHLNDIDGSYSAWSFDNITMLDSDTIIVFYGNRPAHYATEGNKTYMCRYTISTGAKVNTLTPFNEVAQSLIKHENTWYVFTSSKRYATTDFSTWTEASITAGYTPMYGVNFNGRFIALPNSSAQGHVLYSDDLGLTWTTLNLGNSMYITHGGIAIVNGTLVIYCTSTSPTNSAYIGVVECGDRYVITSTNGTTWTSPVRCSGDLEYGGSSYVSGAFEHIGDDWYYFTSNRSQIPPISGRMNLFKGSASDVINGTMKLVNTITIAVDPNYSGTVSGAYMTDNGNVGMCTDGTNLWCTYNRPLGHAVVDWCSNSMQVLVCMSKVRRSKVTSDDYYDPDWVTKRDAFISAKDKSHTWYAYLNDTNITQANMKSGQASTEYGDVTSLINDTFEFDDDIEIPFTNGFRLEIAFNRFTSTSSGNRIGANINGDSYSAYTGTSNGVFVPAVTQTNTAGTGVAKVHKRTATNPDYLILEYNKNNSGKLYAYCNGIEIESIENVCDADTYAWPTQNVVYIESVWPYLTSRSNVNNAELKAFTIDIW